jgi:hypothetical protein
MSKKQRWTDIVNVCDLRIGDHMQCHGQYLLVTKTKLYTKEHPILLYTIWLDGLKAQLHVPDGLHVKIIREKEITS